MGQETFFYPTATEKSLLDIELKSEKIANDLQYKPGDSLGDLVRKIGGEIKYLDFLSFAKTMSGSLIVRQESDFTIYLPEHTARLRDRFTIAHELGHYFLHYLGANPDIRLSKPMHATRSGTGLIEQQANAFSAAFLMPKEKFCKEFNENHDLFSVANYFRVSTSAANVRANLIGLL